MKHDLKITLILIAFFIMAQLIGLTFLNIITVEKIVDGKRTVSYDESKIGEVPKMSGPGFFIYILIGVGLGTALVMLIIKFNKIMIWRVWFFLAVVIAISMALKVIMNEFMALLIASLLGIFKVYKPNVISHNVTEVLMYAGIAVFLVPILDGNVFWALMLLLAISVYDFIAVFKSKHMVTMAKFQTNTRLFAGLFIPYKAKDDQSKIISSGIKPSKRATGKVMKKAPGLFPPKPMEETKSAVLGGGDIAFPLIFTGTVMQNLAVGGLSKMASFYQSSLIILTTTIALALLFFLAKKDKFYPAMPIITIGCVAGYILIWLF